jgi:hypothetical protein
MTYEEFLETLHPSANPPAGLSPELASLWLTKAERWREAHEIAQDLPTKMGSWIHGLLHAIEGDFGNAAYWYRLAGESPINAFEIPAEWERLVRANLPS